MKQALQVFAISVLLAGVTDAVFAQSSAGPGGSVIGKVIDGVTGDPIATATIAVWSPQDSTLVTGAITTTDGAFRIDGLSGGGYYVKVSFVGFGTATVDGVTVGGEAGETSLGTIRLEPDTALLGEVEVTAERDFMEIGTDRTVYNTKDQLVSAGGSASDVLQNIPSVEVDIDGNVSLRGNQNVAILINGKPSPVTGDALASFLQSLPSNAVERVEVIPNPSARYEPDGMSGILNIVLKQDTDLGLSGTLTAGAGTQENYNASGTLNYRKGPIGLLANYAFRQNTRTSFGGLFRENRFLNPVTYLDQTSTGDNFSRSNVVNVGLDYQLSKKNTLTFSTLISGRGGEQDGLNAYSILDADLDLLDRYDRANFGDRADLGMDYRLSFRRVVTPSEHELVVGLRYNTERDEDFEQFSEQAFPVAGGPAALNPELQRNEEEEANREGELQIDYVRPIGTTGKLETGYKGSLRTLDSRFFSGSFDYGLDAYVPDLSLNNEFIFDEQVHAAYGIYGQEFGALGVQVGARAEQALTRFDLASTDESFENNYFSLFPSAFLNYKLSDVRQVRLSYSKRINRPRTRALNPFTSYDDPLNRRVGNPYLKPEYVHAFELSYTRFTERGSLTMSPYFRRTIDEIRRYQTINDEGVTTLTFENFDTSDSYGAEAIATFRLGSRLNSYASFNAYQIVTDGSNIASDLSNSAFGWTGRLNASVEVNRGLDVQVSYFYRSPIDIENGRIGAFSGSNVALRQQFLGDQASLSLRVNDVFNTMGFNLSRDDTRFYETSNRSWQSRMAVLNFTYNFGKPPRNNRNDRAERDTGYEEEVDL